MLKALQRTSKIDSPVCWNRTSGPAGPVDSRLIKAPTLEAHLLVFMKPCAAVRTVSSPPFSSSMRGTASLISGLDTITRAISSAVPTHAAQSDAPAQELNRFGLLAAPYLKVKYSQCDSISKSRTAIHSLNSADLRCCRARRPSEHNPSIVVLTHAAQTTGVKCRGMPGLSNTESKCALIMTALLLRALLGAMRTMMFVRLL